VDPDPDGFALIFVGWIRIQEGKNTHKNKETSEEKFMFCSEEKFISCFASCFSHRPGDKK
jgi:hypothetical protein